MKLADYALVALAMAIATLMVLFFVQTLDRMVMADRSEACWTAAHRCTQDRYEFPPNREYACDYLFQNCVTR